MRETTLQDWAPLIQAMFKNPDWGVLTDHVDDLLDIAARERQAIADAGRVLTLPDDEPMGAELFWSLSRALDFDAEEVSIPGVPDDLSLDEIVWTAGLYRGFLESVTAHGIDRPLVLVKHRSEWRARFYEAAHAIRTYSPTAPLALPAPIEGAVEGADAGTLTVDEASALLGFHAKTVLRYLRSGELAGKIVERRWRIRREDVSAFNRLLKSRGLR